VRRKTSLRDSFHFPLFHSSTCNLPAEARSTCDDIVDSAPSCLRLSVPAPTSNSPDFHNGMAPPHTTPTTNDLWHNSRPYRWPCTCNDIVDGAPSRPRLLVPTPTPNGPDFDEDTAPPQLVAASPHPDVLHARGAVSHLLLLYTPQRPDTALRACIGGPHFDRVRGQHHLP